ncbi:hypothetical protein [Microbacterium sp. NPDC087589]|uniref:hypothetical protein n=1 Tax=Microbacterium sp. NPDC087589 TaxID=3364191 RepID=UPI0037F39B84
MSEFPSAQDRESRALELKAYLRRHMSQGNPELRKLVLENGRFVVRSSAQLQETFDLDAVREEFRQLGFHSVVSNQRERGKPFVRFLSPPNGPLTLYRGCYPGAERRMSWTTDPVMANTYRAAYGGPVGRVMKVTIDGNDAFARYSFDKEYLIDPDTVTPLDVTAEVEHLGRYVVNRDFSYGEIIAYQKF